MPADKAILTDADLAERWGCSEGVIAGHRKRGLKSFRAAHKASASAPGASLWRHRLADVEAYEQQLVDEVEAERAVADATPAPARRATTRSAQRASAREDMAAIGPLRPRPPKVSGPVTR